MLFLSTIVATLAVAVSAAPFLATSQFGSPNKWEIRKHTNTSPDKFVPPMVTAPLQDNPTWDQASAQSVPAPGQSPEIAREQPTFDFAQSAPLRGEDSG